MARHGKAGQGRAGQGRAGQGNRPVADSAGVKTGAATMASVAPTAIPKSAACSAAMSLIPSPQYATVCPSPCDSKSTEVSRNFRAALKCHLCDLPEGLGSM